MPHTPPRVEIQIKGMHCTSCALNVEKHLTKEGFGDVSVDFSSATASLLLNDGQNQVQLEKAIRALGYSITQHDPSGHEHPHGISETGFSIEKKLILCVIFTLPLIAPMLLPFWSATHFLHTPWIQSLFSLPIVLVAIQHFGRSAFTALKNKYANMDVLVIIGVLSAYLYSFVGMLLHDPAMIFFETAATITTFVLLGNVIESRSVKKTTSAIEGLSKLQPLEAKLISIDGSHQIIAVSAIRSGNRLLVAEGDRVPTDGEVIEGECSVDESMISGESAPKSRKSGERVIGGTVVVDGWIKMKATAIGDKTVLSRIIDSVKNAQRDRPQIQKLGDTVSGYFVPAVLILSALTLFISLLLHVPFTQALLRSVAVLVIACPCAMGLATPTAISVGIGRAAKRGILIKGGGTIEELAKITVVGFDKTGTLTSGVFSVESLKAMLVSASELKSIIRSLEQYSSHPIGKSLVATFQDAPVVSFTDVEEQKGIGIFGVGSDGKHYAVGSHKIAAGIATDLSHQIYIKREKEIIGWIDLKDTVKHEAAQTISRLHEMDIRTVMLSGDIESKCAEVAAAVGIDEFHSSMTPDEKLQYIRSLRESKTVAFVGDGINDAPSLAAANIGISLSDATQIAIDASHVVLMDGQLGLVPESIALGRATYRTIKQNLFWAFFYNILALPIAAFGFLAPMVASLTMALSDVMVIGNSLLLKSKRLS